MKSNHANINTVRVEKSIREPFSPGSEVVSEVKVSLQKYSSETAPKTFGH